MAALAAAPAAGHTPPPHHSHSHPCHLQGKVKQIVGSSLRDLGGAGGEPVTNFEASLPSSFYARLYRQCGLAGGHVIMLGADRESRWGGVGRGWGGRLGAGSGRAGGGHGQRATRSLRRPTTVTPPPPPAAARRRRP